MGRAREILLGLLEAFREAMPGAEFREALDAREGFRPGRCRRRASRGTSGARSWPFRCTGRGEMGSGRCWTG